MVAGISNSLRYQARDQLETLAQQHLGLELKILRIDSQNSGSVGGVEVEDLQRALRVAGVDISQGAVSQ